MPNCLSCENVRPRKGNKQMAAMGFVCCERRDAAWTRSINSQADCKDFREAADGEKIAIRVEWAARMDK